MSIKQDNYSTKHAPGMVPDPAVACAVKETLVNNAISCAAAADIAFKLRKPMQEVGTAIDLLGGRIIKCQLGLFGYHPRKKIVTSEERAAPEVEAALKNRAIDGRLPCAAVWEIAAAFAVPRIKVASICERGVIKIKPCQLGAF